MADTAFYRTDDVNTYTTQGNEYLLVNDALPDGHEFTKKTAIGGGNANKKVGGRSDFNRIPGSYGVR